jgi:hypothetical protein
MRDTDAGYGCGIRMRDTDARYGMRDTGCEIRDARYEEAALAELRNFLK